MLILNQTSWIDSGSGAHLCVSSTNWTGGLAQWSARACLLWLTHRFVVQTQPDTAVQNRTWRVLLPCRITERSVNKVAAWQPRAAKRARAAHCFGFIAAHAGGAVLHFIKTKCRLAPRPSGGTERVPFCGGGEAACNHGDRGCNEITRKDGEWPTRFPRPNVTRQNKIRVGTAGSVSPGLSTDAASTEGSLPKK